jgi:Uma2 family endonuclease
MATVTEQLLPPLQSGERMTRAEFLRRWEAQPELKFAEHIGGIAYIMSSPVSFEHSDRDRDLACWTGNYQAATPGTAGGANGTAFIGDETLQPDQNLRVLPEYGGGSWPKGEYFAGKPELLAEISKTSAVYDLGLKAESYQGAKIPEYLAILLDEKKIRWHVLVDDRYQLLAPDSGGIWRSQVFPGLWLDGAAFLRGDLKQVLSCLQDGLPSAEHQAFVAKLDQARRK